MGKAQSKRGAFLLQHPICCFCGGKTAATTIDHIPARTFFTGRQWPEGYEFPACSACNHGSRMAEAVAAVISRTAPDTNVVEELSELKKMLEGVKNNDRKTFDELTSPYAKQIIASTLTSLHLPAAFVDRLPIIFIGPRSLQHLATFAEKLIKALHYKHTGNIVPFGARLLKSVYTNAAHASGKGPPASLRDLPAQPNMSRNAKPLKDQFEYRYGRTADGLCSLFDIRFRQAFTISGLVNSRAV